MQQIHLERVEDRNRWVVRQLLLDTPGAVSGGPSSDPEVPLFPFRVEARHVHTKLSFTPKHTTCCVARTLLESRIADANRLARLEGTPLARKRSCDCKTDPPHGAGTRQSARETCGEGLSSAHSAIVRSVILEVGAVPRGPRTAGSSAAANTVEYIDRVAPVLRPAPKGPTAEVTFCLSLSLLEDVVECRRDAGGEAVAQAPGRRPPSPQFPPFLAYSIPPSVDDGGANGFHKPERAAAGDAGIELLPVQHVRVVDDEARAGPTAEDACQQGAVRQPARRRIICDYLPFTVSVLVPAAMLPARTPPLRGGDDAVAASQGRTLSLAVDIHSMACTSPQAYRAAVDGFVKVLSRDYSYYTNMQRFALRHDMAEALPGATQREGAMYAANKRPRLERAFRTSDSGIGWVGVARVQTKHGIPVERCLIPGAAVVRTVVPPAARHTDPALRGRRVVTLDGSSSLDSLAYELEGLCDADAAPASPAR